jgi:tripartite-type tricarboxylate transporter receptor subunit TctC
LAFSSLATAQNYPNKPVMLINPWTPGGPAELLTRIIGAKLHEQLGQPFVIENKPGANGTIGATFVARAKPDGYTILFSHVGPMAIHPAVVEKMPYDTLKDFEPVTQVAAGALVFIVRNGLPVKNVKEFLAYAKANQGKLSCGSVGPASTSHLACEQLNMLGGVQTIHVPYKGSAPVVSDMLGGTIDIAFVNIAAVKPQLDAGQIRPLAVTTLKRSAVLDLPTMNEILPGFEVNSWYGMMAPAGTPKQIVNLLQRETAKALKMPDVQERLKSFGLDPVGSTPEEHAAQLKEDLVRWGKVARAAKLKID